MYRVCILYLDLDFLSMFLYDIGQTDYYLYG